MVEELFEKKVKSNSSEGEELQVALLLTKQCEEEHFLIPMPNPIEAIKIKIEEKGLKNKDLAGIINQE